MVDINNRLVIINGSNYSFNDVEYIEKFNYFSDYNDVGEIVAYLDILFKFDRGNVEKTITIRFIGVVYLKINNMGGGITQLCDFNISCNRNFGYNKYHVEDYESDTIDFYCSEIEVI
jgi:hypothetical protein